MIYRKSTMIVIVMMTIKGLYWNNTIKDIDNNDDGI